MPVLRAATPMISSRHILDDARTTVSLAGCNRKLLRAGIGHLPFLSCYHAAVGVCTENLDPNVMVMGGPCRFAMYLATLVMVVRLPSLPAFQSSA